MLPSPRLGPFNGKTAANSTIGPWPRHESTRVRTLHEPGPNKLPLGPPNQLLINRFLAYKYEKNVCNNKGKTVITMGRKNKKKGKL